MEGLRTALNALYLLPTAAKGWTRYAVANDAQARTEAKASLALLHGEEV